MSLHSNSFKNGLLLKLTLKFAEAKLNHSIYLRQKGSILLPHNTVVECPSDPSIPYLPPPPNGPISCMETKCVLMFSTHFSTLEHRSSQNACFKHTHEHLIIIISTDLHIEIYILKDFWSKMQAIIFEHSSTILQN